MTYPPSAAKPEGDEPYQPPHQTQPYPQQPYPQQPYQPSYQPQLYYQPQPYPGQAPAYPPQYGYAPRQTTPTNGLGVAGFVCGLVGLVFCWIPFVGIALAVLGVVLGGSGMSQARRTQSSAGLAIAGLVLGVIACIPAIIIMVAIFSS